MVWGWPVVLVPAIPVWGPCGLGGGVGRFSCLSWRGAWVLCPVFRGQGVVSVVLDGCVGGRCPCIGGDVWGDFW